MRIGELARRAGVSTSRIRFYESRGILSPPERLPNGYRVYGDYDLKVLVFINRAQSLGFTLEEVTQHLRSPSGAARKPRFLSRLEVKLVEIDAHLEEVRARRQAIAEIISQLKEAGY